MNTPLTTHKPTMYGIKNCDTIKKAKNYLDEQQVAYQFHDYRTDGINREMLEQFVNQLGYEALLNTRGTTWRKLSDAEKASALSDRGQAIELMLAQPSIIKRPLLVSGNRMLLGFKPENYSQFLSEGQ